MLKAREADLPEVTDTEEGGWLQHREGAVASAARFLVGQWRALIAEAVARWSEDPEGSEVQNIWQQAAATVAVTKAS